MGTFGGLLRGFAAPMATAYADIVIGAELGLLRDAVRSVGSKWRVMPVPSEWKSDVYEILKRYTAGASLWNVKGFWLGADEPSLAIRVIGDPSNKDTFGKLHTRMRCLASELQEHFKQYEVWMLWHSVHGQVWLERFGTGEGTTRMNPSACEALRRKKVDE